MSSEKQEPAIAKDAVLVASSQMPADTPVVSGYDWNKGLDYDRLLQTYLTSGFQATNFGKAVNEINSMVSKIIELTVGKLGFFIECLFCVDSLQLDCRQIPLKADMIDSYEDDEFIRRKNNCTIFMGYTSNMVSSGLRETIRFLVQHKYVS